MKRKSYSLVGVNGNAYSIMAYVTNAMRDVGMTRAQADDYVKLATSGDYDHLIAVSLDQLDQVNDDLRIPSAFSSTGIVDLVLHRDPDEVSTEIDALHRKYVPASGPADTLGGEILRAVVRIGYRFYNDGDCLNVGYGIETTNMAGRYLQHHADHVISDVVVEMMRGSSGDYSHLLKVLLERTLEYLTTNSEVFTVSNPCDMFDYDDPSDYICEYDTDESEYDEAY